MKTTDGRKTNLCKVLRDQLGPPRDVELSKPIWEFWTPAPNDRPAWRTKAREVAEEHENSIYEKLENNRQKRWADEDRINTVVNLRILESLAELTLEEQPPPTSPSRAPTGSHATPSAPPPPFERRLFKWEWAPRVNVFATPQKKSKPVVEKTKLTAFQLWLYNITSADRPPDEVE
jgi:hypothetical protein